MLSRTLVRNHCLYLFDTSTDKTLLNLIGFLFISSLFNFQGPIPHSQATRSRSSLSSALQLYYNFFRLSTPFLSFFEKLFMPFPKLLKSCTFARRSFLATFTYYHLFLPLSTGFVTPYQAFHFLQNTVFTIYIIYIIYNALNDVVCPTFRQNKIRAN